MLLVATICDASVTMKDDQSGDVEYHCCKWSNHIKGLKVGELGMQYCIMISTINAETNVFFLS